MNKFGCMVEETIFDYPHVEKVIKAPAVDKFTMSEQQQEAWMYDAAERSKQRLSGNAPTPIATCADRSKETPEEAFMIFPAFSAQVSESNPKATYEGRCFEEIDFEYESVNETTFNVIVTTKNPKQTVCNDTILFANTEIQHFEVFYFHGTHKLTFEMNTPEA